MYQLYSTYSFNCYGVEMPGMDDLIRLSAGRWLIPILALADARGGLRFAEAVRTLGIARGVARANFAALLGGGWLTPNTGHGHPLRPEYRLSFPGVQTAQWAAAVMSAREELGLAPDGLTRWTLPLIAALDDERRFNELSERLRPISPRALSLTIKQAMADGLVTRRLVDGFPPVPLYARGERGERLAAAMER